MEMFRNVKCSRQVARVNLFFFFFFFATVGGMQGSWLLGLQWKRRVLTTGRPGKSPEPHFFVVFSYFLVLGLYF